MLQQSETKCCGHTTCSFHLSIWISELKVLSQPSGRRSSSNSRTKQCSKEEPSSHDCEYLEYHSALNIPQQYVQGLVGA